MIVKEYKFGNTIVKVHDDAYKDKTQEDIDRILRRIEEIGSMALNERADEA